MESALALLLLKLGGFERKRKEIVPGNSSRNSCLSGRRPNVVLMVEAEAQINFTGSFDAYTVIFIFETNLRMFVSSSSLQTER